ncbi:MAG TPA: DUF2914 domain-containing protein [Myxococcaceae bacterium]|nr:DUF2914 domain-containing protein [Myxococcaceae bacterium]
MIDATPAVAESQPLWQRIQGFRERHERGEMALFFGAGFIFDVVTLDRIDNWANLAQQGSYLLALGLLLALEQRYRMGGDVPPRGLRLLWRFREDAAHFLLGSLLSTYALFFFKSASGISALFFMAFIFGLLLANELPRFRRLGPVVRVGLYSLSLTAYFGYLLPVLFGRLEAWLFVAAAVLSAVPLVILFRLALRWGGARASAFRQLLAPAAIVQALLLALYFAGAIPPVPLALQYLGVYHDVRNLRGEFQLHHQRPAWKLWQHGDQTFLHRPGDKAFIFARVFAPMTVEKGNLPIHFQWFFQDPQRGWIPQGSWTYGNLRGGRAEGFRIFTTRSDPKPGHWRVEVHAPDGRELGSIGFTVIPDGSAETRVFRVERG